VLPSVSPEERGPIEAAVLAAQFPLCVHATGQLSRADDSYAARFPSPVVGEIGLEDAARSLRFSASLP
jgi:hypothetical protein